MLWLICVCHLTNFNLTLLLAAESESEDIQPKFEPHTAKLEGQ